MWNNFRSKGADSTTCSRGIVSRRSKARRRPSTRSSTRPPRPPTRRWATSRMCWRRRTARLSTSERPWSRMSKSSSRFTLRKIWEYWDVVIWGLRIYWYMQIQYYEDKMRCQRYTRKRSDLGNGSWEKSRHSMRTGWKPTSKRWRQDNACNTIIIHGAIILWCVEATIHIWFHGIMICTMVTWHMLLWWFMMKI